MELFVQFAQCGICNNTYLWFPRLPLYNSVPVWFHHRMVCNNIGNPLRCQGSHWKVLFSPEWHCTWVDQTLCMFVSKPLERFHLVDFESVCTIFSCGGAFHDPPRWWASNYPQRWIRSAKHPGHMTLVGWVSPLSPLLHIHAWCILCISVSTVVNLKVKV